MKNRILLSVLCVLLIGGCAAQPQTPPASDDLPAPSALPEKTIPQSALMSESPISPTNLDDYLFLDDVLYFDLRSPCLLYTSFHLFVMDVDELTSHAGQLRGLLHHPQRSGNDFEPA